MTSSVEECGGTASVTTSSAQHVTEILAASPDLILVCDQFGVIDFVSSSVGRILGRDGSGMLGRNLLELTHPDDAGTTAQLLVAVVDTKAPLASATVLRLRHFDGDWRQLEVLANHLDGSDSGAVVLNARETTNRSDSFAASTAQSSFQQAFQRSPIGMALTTVDGDYVRVNQAMCDLLDCSEEVVLRTSVLETTHPDDLRATVDEAIRLLDGETVSFSLEKRFLASGDRPVWARATTTLLRDDDGRPLHFLTQVEDIEARHQLMEQLRISALRDPLTKLANRAGLGEYLASLSPDEPVGVIALDLDRFKSVNDASGHAAGDEVLRTVAARISSSIRDDDHAARTGGDEFLVVITGRSCIDEIRSMASRFVKLIREPIPIEDHTVEIGASAGVVVGFAADAEEMMVKADHASYRAKRCGGDLVAFA